MGWAVLYIAFGIVALWLLGEVLLQYKARLGGCWPSSGSSASSSVY
ncbi:hypothetical protein SVIOM74S_02521 [Streptomyces violarus]